MSGLITLYGPKKDDVAIVPDQEEYMEEIKDDKGLPVNAVLKTRHSADKQYFLDKGWTTEPPKPKTRAKKEPADEGK